MKTQGLVFVATAVFMAVIGLIYWFTSYEPSGTTMLGLTVGIGLIPGVALLRWAHRARPLPGDRPEADPDDVRGALGTFPESSVWPLVLAAGAAMTGVGLVFGIWASLPGGLLILVAFVGGVMESRGQHL